MVDRGEGSMIGVGQDMSGPDSAVVGSQVRELRVLLRTKPMDGCS